MRLIRLIPALVLLMPAAAFAQSQIGQGAITYVSKTDYFSIGFPNEPKVQAITYPTEYRITVPARVYTSDIGRNHYAVTVVDYTGAQKLHEARNEKCMEEAGASKPGLTAQQRHDLVGDRCQDDGPEEVRGAVTYAMWNMVQKAAKITNLSTYNLDRVEGLEVHIINADESRTYAVIHMYENRLYIASATVPKGAPAANWFQVNMRFLDAQYNPVRYEWNGLQVYINGMPAPPRTNQGGRQGGAAPQ